ncbi:nucleotidyltransferase family protein [Roseovarius salinarum]|uniref:nucleotidyltransferase family protein n=1 Tax=Roseovarius salinarum TaxID=1981892 RepID=UPI000C3223E2|nr:nucleotidyltransferase family protein [Roseovarius salinarum]
MPDVPFPVMLFAAGFGTRMGPLTAERPKPLLPVAGRPLVDHALGLARQAGAPRIVVNLHYKAEMMARHLEGSGVLLSHETPDILDTGGGLRAALPLLDSATAFTLNTDAIFAGTNPLTALLERWHPEEMDALLLCVPAERAEGHAGGGDFRVGGDGRVHRGGNLVYTGAQIFKTGGLSGISDRVFSLNRLWDDMMARGRLQAVSYDGSWCDVGTPEGIALAERMVGGRDVHG